MISPRLIPPVARTYAIAAPACAPSSSAYSAQCLPTIASRLVEKACGLLRFACCFRLRSGLETAAESEMQGHALRQLFALYAQERQPRCIDAQLLLLDGAQIGFADAVTRSRQFERTLVVSH